LSVLPDRYDNTALVVAGMTGAALVLAAFVLPQRLSELALCAGCAMLLAVGALLA
jgi:predicted membrane-bound mannosyltransferase